MTLAIANIPTRLRNISKPPLNPRKGLWRRCGGLFKRKVTARTLKRSTCLFCTTRFWRAPAQTPTCPDEQRIPRQGTAFFLDTVAHDHSRLHVADRSACAAAVAPRIARSRRSPTPIRRGSARHLRTARRIKPYPAAAIRPCRFPDRSVPSPPPDWR
jgi:hypothetical protein